MANEEVVAELAAVRECLSQVAAGIQDLVPRGELTQASTAVVEDNQRWRRSVALLIIGGPVLFLANIGIFLQTRHNEATFKADIRDGISCLLGDEASHRHDQRNLEMAVRERLGLDFELGPPTNVATEDLRILVGRCPEVLSRFVDLSLGSQGHQQNEAGGHP